MNLHAFIPSFITVAGAEIGDKTQLLAMVFATRYRKIGPIVLGILVAVLLNHLLAALLGGWLGQNLSPALLSIILGISFLLAAVWMFIPEKSTIDTEETHYHSNIFITTVIAFFIAEMGDKTQILTAISAAKFQTIFVVILGTTLGILVATIPAVILGEKVGKRMPIKLIKSLAAIVFLILAGIEFYHLS